jgi:hypothetical protein
MDKVRLKSNKVLSKGWSKLKNKLLMDEAMIEIPKEARTLFRFYIINTIGFTRNQIQTTNHQMSREYPTEPLGWSEGKVRYWRDWLVKHGFITKTEVLWKDEQHKNEHRTINDIDVVVNPDYWHPPKYILKEIRVAPPLVHKEQGLHQITGSEEVTINEFSLV